MIDRRKVAPALVLLAAGLAAGATFLDAYSSTFSGQVSPALTYTSTMWVVTARSGVPADDAPDAFYAAGWPVMIAALLMVVAAVLLARDGKAATIGRPVVLATAGGLAGIVLAYVIQVEHEEDIMNSWPDTDRGSYEMVFHSGIYLLVVAVIVGLVGAALAQKKQQPQPEEDEEDENEVVVHQLGSDDDTPPFGIAVLSHELQEERETR